MSEENYLREIKAAVLDECYECGSEDTIIKMGN